jgi:hypothetical protein
MVKFMVKWLFGIAVSGRYTLTEHSLTLDGVWVHVAAEAVLGRPA